MKKFYLLLLLFGFTSVYFAQVKDLELGALDRYGQRQQGGYFDYSEPGELNMKVAVWGFVKYPGRYLVPITTSLTDLLSYSGGPTDDADLEDIRVYRILQDSTQSLIKVNYNDLVWEENLKTNTKFIPDLQASDVILVPGSPRLYFKDWFSIGLSVFSALISLAILILNIARN